MLKPFFIRQNKTLRKVDPATVVCLYTEGNYTKIFLADQTYYMVRSTLTNALKKLPPDIFFKIHRSFAASIFYFDYIDKDHLLVAGESIPIGKGFYKSLIARLDVIE